MGVGRGGGSDKVACLLHRQAAEVEFGPPTHNCTRMAPKMEIGMGDIVGAVQGVRSCCRWQPPQTLPQGRALAGSATDCANLQCLRNFTLSNKRGL